MPGSTRLACGKDYSVRGSLLIIKSHGYPPIVGFPLIVPSGAGLQVLGYERTDNYDANNAPESHL